MRRLKPFLWIALTIALLLLSPLFITYKLFLTYLLVILSIFFFAHIGFQSSSILVKIISVYYILAYPVKIIYLLAEHSPLYLGSDPYRYQDLQTSFCFLLSILYILPFLLVLLFKYITRSFTVLPSVYDEPQSNSYLQKSWPSRALLLVPIAALIILYVQLRLSIGVHGLPNQTILPFRLVGILQYSRDYFLPFLTVYLSTKYRNSSPLVLLLAVLCLLLIPIYSLTKVSTLLWSIAVLFLLYSYCRNKRISFLFPALILIATSFASLLLQSLIRDFLYPLHMSLGVYHFGLSTDLYLSAVSSLLDPERLHEFSLALLNGLYLRLTGFYEFASIISSGHSIDYFPTTISLFFGTVLPDASSYRQIVGSTQGGGIGADLLSSALMTGPYFLLLILTFALLMFCFSYLKRTFSRGKLHYALTRDVMNIATILFSVVVVRFMIDGNIIFFFNSTVLFLSLVIMSLFFSKRQSLH